MDVDLKLFVLMQVVDTCPPLQDHEVEVNVKVCALSEKCTEVPSEIAVMQNV
jgi:hypothetical protein